MSLSTSEYSAMVSLLGKVQTALDAVGKARRDVRFMLKERRGLPAEVFMAFQSIDTLLSAVLSQGDELESGAIRAMQGPEGDQEGDFPGG